MTQVIYTFIHHIIRYSGIAALFRYLFARNRISIVTYHDPKPGYFEKHLHYLSGKYNPISFSEYIQAIQSNTLDSLPRYALIVTIDDGWKGNYKLLPLVRQFQIRPTIFLTSHIIDTERHYWWTACSKSDVDRFKGLSNQERINELRTKYNYSLEKEFPDDRQALNMGELEQMKNDFEFGLHTGSHPILTQCSSEEKQQEIVEGKSSLEAKLGMAIATFSYPNGDYDQACIDLLQACGIKVARTIDSGWNNKRSFDPYKLKVTGVSDNGSVTKLVAELTGIPMYMQYLFDGRLNGLKRTISN